MSKALAKREHARPAIKTPQELVHIKHKISLRQYKYWLLFLRAYRESYELGQGASENGFYRIQLSQITDWLGYEPVKAELKSDLEAIRKESIIYNVLSKDGKEVMRGSGFIYEWELSSNWVGFKLPDFLRESIEQLDIKGSIFQQLNWSIFNSFTGKYEAIIYKLCKDYVGVRRTPVMSIADFREYMGLKPTEYPEFKDLNKYIISSPVARINQSEVSDITVEVLLTRENRKVATVQFLVEMKKQTMLDLGDDPAFRFARVPISLAQQRKYLAERSSEAISASIERANEYATEQEAKGKSVNLGGLYRKAIEEDWGKDFEAKKALEAEKHLAAERQKEAEQKKRKAAKVAAADDQADRETLWNAFLELPEAKRAEIAELFIGDNKFVRTSYQKLGVESPLIRPKIIGYLRQKQTESSA